MLRSILDDRGAFVIDLAFRRVQILGSDSLENGRPAAT